MWGRLIIFLLLIHTVGACSPLLSALTSSQYAPFTASAVIIASSAVAVAYFYAKLSKDRKLLVAVKDNISSLFLSLALILAVELFALFLCSAYSYFTGAPIGSLVNASWEVAESFDNQYRAYLSIVEGKRIEEAKKMAHISVLKSLNILLSESYTLAYPTYPEARVFYNIYTIRSGFLTNLLLGSVYMQKAILYLLKALWLEGLLVAGFILRLIPGMRGAGNILLTLYVSFAFVFPFLYAVTGYAFSDIAGVGDGICRDIKAYAEDGSISFSQPFPHPVGCSEVGGILHQGLLQLFSVWMPSVILGITLQFASAFRRILEFEVS